MFHAEERLAVIDPKHTGRILVFGDIHGDLQALKAGLSHRKPGDLLLFLGDYADRGPEGVEVIEGIFELTRRAPGRVIALKGNHEDYDVQGVPKFYPCTLVEEAEKKRGSWKRFLSDVFLSFVEGLYIAALLPGFALFVHGGPPAHLESRECLWRPSRMVEDEVIWNDPGPTDGLVSSSRGIGHIFGPDISQRVLENLQLKHVVRSHEPRKALAGPFWEHDNRVVTLSATGVYGGRPSVLIIDLGTITNTKAVML